MRVLIVEDELQLVQHLASALGELSGMTVDHAEDGIIGEQLAEQALYDLIVLDMVLPGHTGLTLLRRLRARGSQVPVLLLTDLDHAEAHPERLHAELLNAGVDDYLSKPFEAGELIARAKAMTRRGKGSTDALLRLADVTINTIEHTVQRDGRDVDVSATEYRILTYLAQHPQAIVSRQKLLEHLYDSDWHHHSHVIEAHIANLRRKLDGGHPVPLIETLTDQGYRLSVPKARA